MTNAIPAVVLGAGGYVGGELLRLLSGHSDFALVAAVSDSQAGNAIDNTFPHLSLPLGGVEFVSRDDWPDTVPDNGPLALFCAAPHGQAAASIAGALAIATHKQLDIHVVDSSADFRYEEQSMWESVYGSAHGAPELLSQFSSAVPEHVENISTPHIGHPGCFATASILAAVPLIRSQLTHPEVFIAGVTGSTGSGRSPQAGTHHPERNSNMFAYKALSHRHSPEIARLTEAASGRPTEVHFVPHSGPFSRGIHVTLQARAIRAIDQGMLLDVYRDAYAGSAFIEVINSPPKLKNVVASNRCQISVACDNQSVVVMATIDNLVKGAAGGAVQWMNRLFDLPETSGLTTPPPGWT